MAEGVTAGLRLWARQLGKQIDGLEAQRAPEVRLGNRPPETCMPFGRGHVGCLLAIADSIEKEVAKRYILRPTDANGEPISVGETVVEEGDVGRVEELRAGSSGAWEVVVLHDDCYRRYVRPDEVSRHEPTPAERIRQWAHEAWDRPCTAGGLYPVSDDELTELSDIADELEGGADDEH